MYLLDPDRGKRRRHILEDRARSAVHHVEDLAGKAERDLANRTRGIEARARGSKPTRRGPRSPLRAGMPERRLVEGGAGGLLALWGLFRGGFIGFSAVIGGSYFVARAALQRPDGVIRVQKTITIDAPIDEVFRVLAQFENYPHFMDHVHAVRRVGDKHFHWKVAGPAGVPVEFDAEIVERVENRKLVWRSVEGSMVRHQGEVHFEHVGEHGTRVNVHMAYHPPGGALTHAVAEFLLADPKTVLDRDLLRLKSLLEGGKSRAHGREVRRDQLLH